MAFEKVEPHIERNCATVMAARPGVATSSPRQYVEPLQKSLFRGAGGPGRQIIALDRGRQHRRRPEEPARLGSAEAGKARRFEKGRAAVRSLDHPRDLF